MEMTDPKEELDIVDDDLVAVFELLAKWDFEDKQEDPSELKTDPPTSSPGDQFSAQI